MIKKLGSSLTAKMLLSLLLALVCALAVFFAVCQIGRSAVDNIYMSHENISARKAAIYSDFNSYVVANRIAGWDTAAIDRWSVKRDYIDIYVYKQPETVSSTPSGSAPSNAMQNIVTPERNVSYASQYTGQYGKLYPMRFSDGQYQIAINDTSNLREIGLNRLIAVFLASIAFIFIMLWYTRRLTMRIITLSREAVEVGAGDLERPIVAEGEDEISMLACEMDNMRRSVIERMGNEKRAWEANSELITAISHDIRTPMTSLIGYLGLLKESQLPDEKSLQFASSAYDKAMDLKGLTDELFKYFLVFGKSELELNKEVFEAGFLMEQLTGEAEFDLMDAGFQVRRVEFEDECSVETDPMYLKRVIDNLISNVKKYADKGHPVMMISEHKDGMLNFCMSNHIAANTDRVESTKIGIRTCEKIMEHMGGSFRITSDGEHFAAEFSLPTI